jgi:hypothetical protein
MDQYQIHQKQGVKGEIQAAEEMEEQTKSTYHHQKYLSPSSPTS